MLSPIKDLLQQFSAGEFIIILDEHREEEGDFFLLAEYVTPEKINFLLHQARGLICVACDESITKKLNVPLMVEKNENKHGTNFCVSVDASQNITTGVSAFDRAHTISLLADRNASPKDFVLPGHTFPLLAKPITERFGHTECAVELAKMAQKTPVVVICEILNIAGEKANREELELIAKKSNCPLTTLEELKKNFMLNA